jgi:HEAT repeat protein
VLKGPALELVRSLDPRGNMELALEKAKLLVGAGEDASDLITTLVNSPRGDERVDTVYSADALELSVAQGHWSLVEASLSHRFADVRKVALEALATRTTGALPPNLLALAADKGSGVRRALVGILNDRPALEHADALVTLAADDWSDRQGYYGQETNYPIAQEAAKTLQKPPPLPERVLEPLIEIAAKTNDPYVRWDLISAIAKNGGANSVGVVPSIGKSRDSRENVATAASATTKKAAKSAIKSRTPFKNPASPRVVGVTGKHQNMSIVKTVKRIGQPQSNRGLISWRMER